MKKFNCILIVDDDPVSNYTTKYFLKKINICDQIFFCRNGKEALQFLDKESNNLPQLILLDLHMPVMDGFEFLEKIEKKGLNQQEVKIVLYTINGEDVSKEHEPYKIIDKPLTMEKFCNAVGFPYELA